MKPQEVLTERKPLSISDETLDGFEARINREIVSYENRLRIEKIRERHAISKSEETKFKDSLGLVYDTAQNQIVGNYDGGLGQIVRSNRGISWNIPFLDTLTRDIGYMINAGIWQSTKPLINGIDLNIYDKDKEVKSAAKIQNYLMEDLFKSQQSTLYLGYFHGGSAGLIYIEGEMDEASLQTPLNTKRIKKGSFKGITPLTRLYQVMPHLEGGMINKIGEDVGIFDASELGKPMFYRVNLGGNLTKINDDGTSSLGTHMIVHRSRLLLYNASELSWVESRIEHYWGVSVGERALVSMKRFESLNRHINGLAKRSNLPVVKVDGLTMATLAGAEYEAKMMNKIDMIEFAIDAGGMILLTPKDELTFENADFKELPQMLMEFKKQLTADLQAPLSVTFAEVGEDDEKDWHWVIRHIQNRILRTWYMQLIPIIYKSMYNKQIEEYSFTFKSLDVLTEKEKAEKLLTAVEIIEKLWEMNALDLESVHKIMLSAIDNISDMLNEITEEYIKIAQEKGEDGEAKTYAYFQVVLAKALNHIQRENQENEQASGYNMTETKVRGKTEGGDPTKKKKPTVTIPINKNRDKE